MQALRLQNKELTRHIQNYMQEIEKQKDLNSQHQNQIQTLLKFNQRLLGIIEHQLNTNKKDNVSLQPISERSERESDLIAPTMHSFVKTRRAGAQSERGGGTANSLVERTNKSNNKLQMYGRQVQKSEVNHSISQEDGSDYRVEVGANMQIQKKQSNQVKNEMSREITELKKFKQESTQFYDNKISEIRNLSQKLTKYKPMDQINQITSKLTLSSNTASLIKNAIQKSNQ